MHNIRKVNSNNITPPIESLEYYFRAGGVTIVQATFSNSFFIDPVSVRGNTPSHPDRARMSREHYPGKGRGETATWPGDGRTVRLGDNAYAQIAWSRYTGCAMQRGTGYGVRHIWGKPWNPDAFTAGWNLCYMPFWAGMLTEDQHLLETLRDTVRQASWDLFFEVNPVCQPPEFVNDPGLDLGSILGELPLLVMKSETGVSKGVLKTPNAGVPAPPSDSLAQLKIIRSETHQSWTNITKAVLALQERSHKPFSTLNVEASSKSCVRKICRETGLTPNDLLALLSQVTSVEDQML